MGYCERKHTKCNHISDVSFREKLTIKADEYEKNIDILAATGSNGNVGTTSADIFSSYVLAGTLYKCELL